MAEKENRRKWAKFVALTIIGTLLACCLLWAGGTVIPLLGPVFFNSEEMRILRQTAGETHEDVLGETYEDVVSSFRELKSAITGKPVPSPAPTPQLTMEDYQSDFRRDIISYLEGLYDVERVNLVRWDEGLLEIEVKTRYHSHSNQPDVSWQIIVAMADGLAGLSPSQRMALTGSEGLYIELTTYSTDGGYRYRSQTEFDTLVRLNNRAIGYEEWVQAANAGFR